MSILFDVRNGNAQVTLQSDGTRFIQWPDGESLVVDSPVSMDVKITNQCSLGPKNGADRGGTACPFCHERSTSDGAHGDLHALIDLLREDGIPRELAIGGGDPLSHPDLEYFLKEVCDMGSIPNITVNGYHVKNGLDQIATFSQYLGGLGISYRRNIQADDIILSRSVVPHIVLHVIAGIDDPKEIQRVAEAYFERVRVPLRVLVLGYKTFGFGETYYSPDVERNIRDWFQWLSLAQKNPALRLSYDNLAIDQLGVSRLYPEHVWKVAYQGDDGTITCYIDAVEQTIARTSRSSVRFPLSAFKTLKDGFDAVRAPKITITPTVP